MTFKRMLPWGNLALLVLFGFLVARAVLIPRQVSDELGPRSSQGQVAAPEAPEQIANAPTGQSQAVDLSSLRQDNLFAGAQTETPPVEQVAIEAPPSPPAWQPQIILQGTITGPDSVARAIVRDKKTGEAQLLGIDDKVGPARLKKITRQSIVLDHKGKDVTVYIQGSQPKVVATFDEKSPLPSTDIDESSIWALYEPTEAAAMGLSQLLVSQTDLAQAETGDVTGLRIKQVDDEFRALGLPLKTGDVALAINGQRLTGKQKAYQVLQKAQAQTHLTMEVLRDGQHLEFSVNEQ